MSNGDGEQEVTGQTVIKLLELLERAEPIREIYLVRQGLDRALNRALIENLARITDVPNNTVWITERGRVALAKRRESRESEH